MALAAAAALIGIAAAFGARRARGAALSGGTLHRYPHGRSPTGRYVLKRKRTR